MPVSEAVRKEVKERCAGNCQLFHSVPFPGDQIVHSDHAGIGGMPEDAPCNQPDVLLYGCQKCHDKLHGLGMPYKIIEIDTENGILEIIDREGRKVPHEQIFFHLWPQWVEAEHRYVTLQKAARGLRMSQRIVARELAWFKGDRKEGLDRWRVSQEANSFWSFSSGVGFTASQAKFFARQGKWVTESKLRRLLVGLDIDMIDALRKADEQDLIDLLGIAQHGKPADLFDELDKMKQKKENRRQFWVTDGKVRQEKAFDKSEIKLQDGEKLIRGSLVIGEAEEGE